MIKKRDDLCKHPLELALEAIEAGNKEEALKYTRQVWDEGRPLHDLHGDYIASLLTFISRRFGEECVEEANRYVGEEVWKPLLMSFRDRGPSALAEAFASFLRAHGYDFSCVEDEEKFMFVARYCPSGGRMKMEGKEETSEGHPYCFGTTKKGYPWSFNRSGVSYYCTHCALFMDLLPREWGWDVCEASIGEKATEVESGVDGPCVITIYKEPRS